MNKFVNALKSSRTRTTNGMPALTATASPTVDFFFKAGASRGMNVLPLFTAARVENRDHALRLALWLRDARAGAGERQLYRDILLDLSNTDPDAAVALVKRTPELGRWDDLLIDFTNEEVKYTAYAMIGDALVAGNGLCAKWMPRKGKKAAELRDFMGWTPKYYRKRLVELTNVVETKMCAREWDSIDFNKLPSVASARYKKAFNRHTTKYAEWTQKLAKGDKTVKVNAGAVYPYDVLKGVDITSESRYSYSSSKAKLSTAEIQHIVAQWNALPNYVGDASILPLVDVSGSMMNPNNLGGSAGLSPLRVAVSLGLYLSDKNRGPFKDTFLTFSAEPEFVTVKGNIVEKCAQMSTAKWEMNTDLVKALQKILKVAVENSVPVEDMPKMLLILSDMQFDSNYITFDKTAFEGIKKLYASAGYETPRVVFWNINSHDNVPVKFHEKGAALISGFSPSIMKSVLKADIREFTPEDVMLKTIMDPRYDY